MIELAVISGSGFYDFPDLKEGDNKVIQTKFGKAAIRTGIIGGRKMAFLARHGKRHSLLPNMINYRANLMALKELDTQAIIATTVCGVLDPGLPLARPAVFDDLYFPDNRLPSGEACSIYIYNDAEERSKGHYIFSNPFSEELRQQVIAAADDPITDAVYAHACGPRFNSKPEIRMLQSFASFVSQTAGPEIVLAGELEIPFALIGFGVDYANGVKEEPTPVEVLSENLRNSKGVFIEIIKKVMKSYKVPRFTGFIYRFN
ncbi:MAG: MTAP family purine nucleoside phosphorylase [Candidatus Aminicenantes bacterium]|nr:MTAP family purine nucleoside phosphorylase [Candidatus Aminicenantes bacterium]MDH5466257.1 MTAP family purine nucleoside phosphorylase [Candidatus Aminicenantes bacterium]MDH5705396.1 MTAP family purine nucleoside phosphorylase [Candidatus Aminicenantes bacterium]